MAQNSVNPKNNNKKATEIMELWYQATGEKFGKVNLATNADFEQAKLAGKKGYIQLVKEKHIPDVYENPINLRKGQNLHLVFYSNTHNYDLSNPKRGIETNKDKILFAHDLNNKMDKDDKTVVIFAGNFLGKEWQMSDLNMAKIINNEIMFWGIKERVKEFINDIKFAALNGANEIILMNGREEHLIDDKTNQKTLQNAIVDKFNDLVFKYAIEVLNKSIEKEEDEEVKKHYKNVLVAYVPEVKKAFNVVRKDSINNKKAFTFSVYTNAKSNAEDLGRFINAVKKQSGGFIDTDAKFIPNPNMFGSDEEHKIYCVTGQSKYKNTAKGNVPRLAPKGRNTCTILFGEESHEIEVVFGNNMKFMNPDLYPAQKKLARKKAECEYLVELSEEKIKEKQNQLINKFANTKLEKGE